MNRLALLALGLSACLAKPLPPPPPPVEQVETAPSDPRFMRPGPLEATAFTLPAVQTAALSNGLQVMLIEDHDLPLFELQLVFKVGSYTDPVGKEGLASASTSMLMEGTRKHDAVALAAALHKLGTSMSAGAGGERASLRLSGLTRNLEPSLDLAAEVLFQPSYKAEDWYRLRKQRVQDVQAARTTPGSMAGRAMGKVLWGDAWQGAVLTEASLAKITVKDLTGWSSKHLVPGNAVIAASGDLSMAQLLPLLEARFGAWKAGSAAPEAPIQPVQPSKTTLTVVDKPGATQSLIQVARFVPGLLDPAWDALTVANQAWGGAFTARLNMNLREQKGWTYGARSGIGAGLGPGVWGASTSVRADATVDAVKEILAELAAVAGDRPLTEAELRYQQSSLILGYPAAFETPDYLLSQQVSIWRYGLPADWAQSYPARVQAVSPDQAQSAFVQHVASQPVAIVVVADLAVLREALGGLGLPMQEVDPDGRALPR